MESVDEARWQLERIGRARVMARGSALATVRAALERTGSLFDWAAARPGAQRLAGRGAAYRVRLDGADWLVRHYRRGGAVAAHLGDRYARVGRPRPFRELGASQAARARGVPTPAVVAAVVYPAGMVYRGDIAVEFIPRSLTLADALFGPADSGTDVAADERERESAARAAGAAIRQGHDRGLVHPDLNMRNILLAETGSGLRGYILDLDGARVVARVGGAARKRMIRRFWRSVRKWEAKTGEVLSRQVRNGFEAGYRTGQAHE
ncbi:MAG: lipopolysaccharide kinase InaA family protein [Gemmatimonadota bacterium]|jgi:3-deoxy-D-manno-octulosonic acid kinase